MTSRCPRCHGEALEPYEPGLDGATMEDSGGRYWHIDCAELQLSEVVY